MASIFSIGVIDDIESGFVINTGVTKEQPLLFMNSLSIFIIGVPTFTFVPASTN